MQAYAHWRRVYLTTRAIQGRINDVSLLLAVSAKRAGDGDGDSEVAEDSGELTGYREDSAKLVQLCTRLIRLSHRLVQSCP